MCVVRRTLSVCKSCASGVQRVQVGCCIVQQQVAHSVPIFLSVAVAHGRPWTHNSNNSDIGYNSYKQVGAEALERQVDPYKQVVAGVKRAGVKRQLVVGLQHHRSRKLMSNRATLQPSIPPRLACNPTSREKLSLLVHHSFHMDTPLADDSFEWRWLHDVTPKYLYRRAWFHWLSPPRGGVIEKS